MADPAGGYPLFQRDTRAPSRKAPPGAWDCQVHVFADPNTYPTRSGNKYPVPPAYLDDMRRMHRTLGVECGLIVQATPYGTNHDLLCDLLTQEARYVGVAIIDDETSDKELARLHAAGVRSARFNFAKFLGMAPSRETFQRAIARISEMGWVAKLHAVAEEYLEFADLFLPLKLPTVIDHMGHFYFKNGMDQPVIPFIDEMLRKENVWIMLSNADRRSAQGAPYDDALPFARRFLAAAPDRCIWGTDWPHTHYQAAMPNDADLLELLYRFAGDEATAKRILVDNPNRLWGGLR